MPFIALIRFFLLWASVVLFLTPAPVRAQVNDHISTPEEVAIAFFKTGETNPDFDLWAKGSKDYHNQPPTRAAEYLYKEKQRLMREWQKFKVEENVLMLETSTAVELKAIQNDDGEYHYWMYMAPADNATTYFPYKFQEYKIAVIPQKFESLMMQPLTKEQYLMMRQDFEDAAGGRARMRIGLKPVKSYMQQPYVIDNNEQWVLLTDVVTLGLISQRTGTPFWYYTADWYVSPKTQELQDLYKTGSDAVSAAPSIP